MTNYSDIEIQTAKNLLKEGYKWIVRYEIGRLIALSKKPIKSTNNLWTTTGDSVCVGRFIPIFQGIRSDDKEPTSLEAIVHPQILDEAEKRYLKGVIRPFRNDVEKICKNAGGKDLELIAFYGKCYFFLPYFDAGTMYKGMKLGHKYSLEELGL